LNGNYSCITGPIVCYGDVHDSTKAVASSITGASATAMIEALIDGERRGQVLADLAIGRMCTAGKLAGLSMALSGRFTEHPHATVPPAP
jgi:hypothetical protein